MAEKIQRKDWVNRFELIGKPKISEYTFNIDVKSKKSSWIYNSMSLYVDCGEKHGDIQCEMMGGYSEDGENYIYAHGKDSNDDKKDDFSKKITVKWEDRFNKEVLNSVGNSCFIRVGLEKNDENKTFYQDFLSEYDAIKYIKEHIEKDMVLRIKGDLEYSLFNDNVYVKKKIKSIVLSQIDDTTKYGAKFMQSILIDKNSVDLKDADKSTGLLPVYATVLDYVKEVNGKEIRGFYPMEKVFDYQLNLKKSDKWQNVYNKFFKVKKGYTQLNFVGELVENGTTTITYEDLPDEIKELIDIGAFELEDALAKCSDNKSKDRKMILLQPLINKTDEDSSNVSSIAKFEERYTIEEIMDIIPQDDEDEETDEEIDNNFDESLDTDDMDWLNNLS